MTSSGAPIGPGGDLRIHAAWCRHRGNFRHENEDTVLVAPLGPALPASSDTGHGVMPTAGAGFVAAVCDGVGGGAAGEVASALAAREFFQAVSEEPAAASAREAWVRRAVERAHAAILRASELDPATEGMGTTMTAVWAIDATLHVVQVGDSRLYRLRGATLEQLSVDQSLVGRMRRAGELTEEQARQHPLRNIVDQIVGGSKSGIRPDVHSVPIARGDTFLLCSDGLTDALPDRIIQRELCAGARQPAEAVVARLLELVLENSGRDNISIILLRAGVRPSALSRWLAALKSRPRP